ncbi:MAG: MazG-like family protein [Patescibacteria group bacterium]
MINVNKNITIRQFQDFINKVYGLSNDRYFSLSDMIVNMERFLMRGLKGIRKRNDQKAKINLLLSLSWFMSIMNRLHIDIEDEVWKRFPYLCSYCGTYPCLCKKEKVEKRRKIIVNNKKKPETLKQFQKMFDDIYPSAARTLEHAGVHLAEELGEFSEAIMTFRGAHKDETFSQVELEAADLFSCLVGVFNSLEEDITNGLVKLYSKNCHVCKKAPCVCNFIDITEFKS